MIPTLYDKTGTIKIGDLNDCIECLVEEERNGVFELTLVYPSNSQLLDSIIYENIVICDANDCLKSQKFRIYNTRRLMSNRVEVCARHISFDLAHDWIDKIEFENQSCEYALNQIFRNSQFCQHFRGHSDIINAQNFKMETVTCLSAIGGTKGSILDTYGNGAEVLRDNLDIHVLNRRGHDNDVSIEYRKNLTGFELEEDTTDLVTRILPYAKYYDQNNKNEEVVVKGTFIDSPNINNYVHPYVKYIDYSDKFDEDNLPTVEQLEKLATKEYTVNKVDIPKQNFKIEFVPLSKCAGYEGLEDKINLCDVVTIRDTRYNIDTQSKVIKVTYDVLRDRYESMELGEPRTTLGDVVGGGNANGPIQGEQGPPGANGDLSDFPNELPHVPVVSAIVYGFANVEISWTFESKIYYTYELYASKTKGFTPNVFDLVFSGQASTFLHQLQPNETWYYRVCATNTHGSRTEFSEEIEVNTVKISDLSNYVESAAIGDALIGELNLGRGWYGELRGNYIDAKQMSVTDGNGKRTLDIDSFGNVNLDVAKFVVRTTNGAYTVYDNSGMNTFNNGGAQTLGIHNGGLTFHPWNTQQLGAYVTQSSLWSGDQSANGLALSTTANGTYVSIGTSTLSDPNSTLSMEQALTISARDNFQPQGINFWKNVHAHGYGIRQLSHLDLAGSAPIRFDYLNNSPSIIYEAVDNGHSLNVMGGYQMHLGVMEGNGTPHGVIWMKNKTDTHSYTHWDFHNYTMYNMRTASSYVNVASRKVAESYGIESNVDGIRYIYKDIKLVNGKAVRNIPSAYAGATYDIVSIVCKGKGQAWIEVEDLDRFEIRGDCTSVNVEIIIHPHIPSMVTMSANLEEGPILELPKILDGEVAPLIKNHNTVRRKNTQKEDCNV